MFSQFNDLLQHHESVTLTFNKQDDGTMTVSVISKLNTYDGKDKSIKDIRNGLSQPLVVKGVTSDDTIPDFIDKLTDYKSDHEELSETTDTLKALLESTKKKANKAVAKASVLGKTDTEEVDDKKSEEQTKSVLESSEPAKSNLFT